MKNILSGIQEIFKRKRADNRIAEASYIDADDHKYKRLSVNYANSNENELLDSVRSRMYKVVYDLNMKNPFAKRIIEITRDFAVGDGLQYDCDNREIKQVIDKFWNNPLNNFDIEISKIVYDLGLWGEICLKMNVNPLNGFVTVSYLDPTRIKEIIVNKNNIKDIESIIFYSEDRLSEIKYKAIRENGQGLLEGDVFYFRINNLMNQVRGVSDLLSLVDWLDALDQFLFNSIERNALLNSFIYQFEWIGMNREEVIEQKRQFGKVKPGSILHTNENVKIHAITPSLNASDTTELARMIKNFILGSAGFPEHWFAEGGYTNMATAKEMGLPTFQKLKERQSLVLKIINDLIRFQVDQAYKYGRLNFDLNNRPKITIRNIDVKESGMSDFTNSLVHLVNFVKSAINGDLIDKETGRKIIQSTLDLNGFKNI
jgi:hypothetical protein